MPAIVKIPTVVAEMLGEMKDLLKNEPQRDHLAEYLTGLIVAKRKTIIGMAREFGATTDQLC